MILISVDLPAPLAPIRPMRSPQDAQIETLDQRFAVVTLADVRQFGDELAGAFTGIQRQLDVADAVTARRAFDPQRFQPTHPAFVAGAPRLDTLADPHLFLRPEFVKTAAGFFLFGQLVGLACFVGGEIARVRAQQAAVEFDDARHHTVEEGAVMGNNDRGFDLALDQQVFEQRDAGDVEMVGRLIQQQQVGLHGEGQRQCSAFAFAAGGGLRRTRFIQTEAVQVFEQPRVSTPAFAFVMHVFEPAARGQAGVQILGVGQQRFLFNRHHAQSVLAADFAVVERATAGDDAEQRGFAGAVAADEADAFAVMDGQVGTVEQRMQAESKFGGVNCQ